MRPIYIFVRSDFLKVVKAVIEVSPREARSLFGLSEFNR